MFYKPACLQAENFHGRLLSIRVFFADGHYLNNRVFLSRNYRLIVAPPKFDVLKTNICPRSEASRANMLVLRTSGHFPRTGTLGCYSSPLNFLRFLLVLIDHVARWCSSAEGHYQPIEPVRRKYPDR